MRPSSPFARPIAIDVSRNATDDDVARLFEDSYGPALGRLPSGRQVFHGLPFDLGDVGPRRWVLLDGPVSIEGYYDEAFSVPGLLAEIAKRDALGCAGMADLAARLSEQHGLPVVDGVASAIKLAEALGAPGFKTSKIGSYAAPRPKAYLGSFASFAPR